MVIMLGRSRGLVKKCEFRPKKLVQVMLDTTNSVEFQLVKKQTTYIISHENFNEISVSMNEQDNRFFLS